MEGGEEVTLAEFLNNDSDPWKFGGWETLTHQEALRRQARAELLEPIRKREVARMAGVLDGMAKRPTPWSSPDADPIADMRALGEASRAAWPHVTPTVWPDSIRRRFPQEVAEWDSPPPTREATDASARLRGEVEKLSAEMARRRDEQLAPYVEAIQTLRESGREVWLEETPPQFETEGVDGDRQTWRTTSTARIRYTGRDRPAVQPRPQPHG
jgi:hypothetical protein